MNYLVFFSTPKMLSESARIDSCEAHLASSRKRAITTAAALFIPVTRELRPSQNEFCPPDGYFQKEKGAAGSQQPLVI